MFLAARTHALLKHDHPCRTSRPVRPYHPAAQSPGFAADPRKSQSRRDYEFAMPTEEDLAAPADASSTAKLPAQAEADTGGTAAAQLPSLVYPP